VLQKIKAKRTFASGKEIYFPHAKEPYTVNADMAEKWKSSGLCECIGEPFSDVETVGGTNTLEVHSESKNEPETPNYDDMNYKELKEHAKEREIPKYNSMKKEALLKALKGE
jgi:hypothetical protein